MSSRRPKPKAAPPSGGIGLIGTPESGKTAYMVSLCLKARNDRNWTFTVADSKFSQYLQGLKQETDGKRRLWRNTTGDLPHRDYSLFVAKRQGLDGWGLVTSLLPAKFSAGFLKTVHVPEVSGELIRSAANPEASTGTEGDLDARVERFLDYLSACSGIICLVDPTMGMNQLDMQLGSVDGVLRRVLEQRERDGVDEPLHISFALTKYDILERDPAFATIRLPASQSNRLEWLERNGKRGPEDGIKEEGLEISYSLKAADAMRPADRGHDASVAWDLLRSKLSPVYEVCARYAQDPRMTVEPFLISSWGHPLQEGTVGGMPGLLFPRIDEINPRRHFDPVVSVLDRTYAAHAARARRRRIVTLAGLWLVGILGLPAAGHILGAAAKWRAEAGDVDTSRIALELAERHPWVQWDLARNPERVSALADASLERADAIFRANDRLDPEAVLAARRARDWSTSQGRSAVSEWLDSRVHQTAATLRASGLVGEVDVLAVLFGLRGGLDPSPTVVEEMLASLAVLSESEQESQLPEAKRSELLGICQDIVTKPWRDDANGTVSMPSALKSAARGPRASLLLAKARAEVATASASGTMGPQLVSTCTDARDATLSTGVPGLVRSYELEVAIPRARLEIAAWRSRRLSKSLLADLETAPEVVKADLIKLSALIREVPYVLPDAQACLDEYILGLRSDLRERLVQSRPVRSVGAPAVDVLRLAEGLAGGVQSYEAVDALAALRSFAKALETDERRPPIQLFQRARDAGKQWDSNVTFPMRDGDAWRFAADLRRCTVELDELVAARALQHLEAGQVWLPEQLLSWRETVEAAAGDVARPLLNCILLYREWSAVEVNSGSGAAPAMLPRSFDEALSASSLTREDVLVGLSAVGVRLATNTDSPEHALAYASALRARRRANPLQAESIARIERGFRDTLLEASTSWPDSERAKLFAEYVSQLDGGAPQDKENQWWFLDRCLRPTTQSFIAGHLSTVAEGLRGESQGEKTARLKPHLAELRTKLGAGESVALESFSRVGQAARSMEAAVVQHAIDACVRHLNFLGQRGQDFAFLSGANGLPSFYLARTESSVQQVREALFACTPPKIEFNLTGNADDLYELSPAGINATYSSILGANQSQSAFGMTSKQAAQLAASLAPDGRLPTREEWAFAYAGLQDEDAVRRRRDSRLQDSAGLEERGDRTDAGIFGLFGNLREWAVDDNGQPGLIGYSYREKSEEKRPATQINLEREFARQPGNHLGQNYLRCGLRVCFSAVPQALEDLFR